MKTKRTLLPLLFSLVLTLGMFFGYKLKENMGIYGPSFSSSNNQSGIKEILSIIDRHYIDSIHNDSLSLLAINSIMEQLDPHSIYIPSSEVQFLKTELQGGFDGIGLEFELLNDTVSVIGVKKASPAAKAGIQTGAQIFKINDRIVSGVKMNPELVRHSVRGPRGSSLSLLVWQNNKKSVIKIERAPITQECIDLALMVKPGVGYIRLNRFAATAYEEFMQHLEMLKNKGMSTLILDLQENGGGMMDDAVQIADEFLDNNKDIVYTEGRNSPKKIFQARRPGLFENGKLFVLINEHSASASEVLAGALQDWDRATIIGRRSFGKGLVQEEFNLSDGSSLRLTVSRYFTPLGRNIQKPYLKGKDSLYENELINRYRNGDLLNNDSSKHKGKEYRTKAGRIVYGGWGITPDQFVAADSAELALLDRDPQIFTEIASSSFNYYNANKEKLASLKQPAELNAFLEKDPLLLTLIKNKIEKSSSASSIRKNAFEFESIKRYAFQYIARLCLGKEGYFSFLLLTDPLYNTAINQLK
jgi:carboxyl-terminal processing protease